MARILSVNDRTLLDVAAAVIQAGEPLVYPTDTIYGLGGNGLSRELTELIYQLKQRPESLPFSVMVSDIDMLKDYALLPKVGAEIIQKFLPGALTIILPLKDYSPLYHIAAPDQTVGFRMPDHQFCIDITRRTGLPVITTSVNLSGQPPMSDIDSIAELYADKIPLYIQDQNLEQLQQKSGSTIIKIDRKGEISLVRNGAIAFGEIMKRIASS